MSFVTKLKGKMNNFIDYLNEEDDPREHTENLKKYDDYSTDEDYTTVKDHGENDKSEDLNKTKFENLINKEKSTARFTRQQYLMKKRKEHGSPIRNRVGKKTSDLRRSTAKGNSNSTSASLRSATGTPMMQNKRTVPARIAKNVVNFVRNVFTTKEQEVREMNNEYVIKDIGGFNTDFRNKQRSKYMRPEQNKKMLLNNEEFKKFVMRSKYDAMMKKQLQESTKKLDKRAMAKDTISSVQRGELGGVSRANTGFNLDFDDYEYGKDIAGSQQMLEMENKELQNRIAYYEKELARKEQQLKTSTDKIKVLERVIDDMDVSKVGNISAGHSKWTEMDNEYNIDDSTDFGLATGYKNTILESEKSKMSPSLPKGMTGDKKEDSDLINSRIKIKKNLVESRRRITNLPEAHVPVLDTLPPNLSPVKEPLFTSSPTRKTSGNKLQPYTLEDIADYEKETEDEDEKISKENDERASRRLDKENIKLQGGLHNATELSPIRVDYSKYSSSPSQAP
ncbi:hypothetical protein ACO0QE_000025 [Hanseniaspora vineae]